MFTAILETPAPGYCEKLHEGPLDTRKSGDTDLVRRIQSGDETAFRELVERYQRKILQIVHGILHRRADAEEVAQEAFAAVYFSIRKIPLPKFTVHLDLSYRGQCGL